MFTFTTDFVLQWYFPQRKNETIPVYYLFRWSSWIGAKIKYYYDDYRLLQLQTDLHFQYVTKLTKCSHQDLPLDDVAVTSDTIRELYSQLPTSTFVDVSPNEPYTLKLSLFALCVDTEVLLPTYPSTVDWVS